MNKEHEQSAHILEHIYYAKENRELFTFTSVQMDLLFRMLHDQKFLQLAFDSWDEIFSDNGSFKNKYKPLYLEKQTMTSDKDITPEQMHELLDRVDALIAKMRRELHLTTFVLYVQTAFIIMLSAYIYFT